MSPWLDPTRPTTCVQTFICHSALRNEADPGSLSQAGDLLKDRRRINVCLTRAKSKLIIVGSRTTVSNSPVMRELLDLVSERDWVYRIPAGETNLPVPAPSPSDSDSTKVANQAVRRGGGALALKNPLLGDITNSID